MIGNTSSLSLSNLALYSNGNGRNAIVLFDETNKKAVDEIIKEKCDRMCVTFVRNRIRFDLALRI